jgi:hypothetical protein
MRNRSQEPWEGIVECLEAVLTELRRLPFPAGSAGSSLLAVLEAVEQERQIMRTRAKALLSKAPAALPGWAVSSANPNGKRRAVGELTPIRAHNRLNALKLIQRRTFSEGK